MDEEDGNISEDGENVEDKVPAEKLMLLGL